MPVVKAEIAGKQGFWLKVKKGQGEKLADILARGFSEPDVEFVCRPGSEHDLVTISGPSEKIKEIKGLLGGLKVV